MIKKHGGKSGRRKWVEERTGKSKNNQNYEIKGESRKNRRKENKIPKRRNKTNVFSHC